MDAEFIRVAGPFLLFAFSLIFCTLWPKVWFITIPATAVWLYLFYSGSFAFQIALSVLWIVLVIGNSKVATFGTTPTPKALFWPLVVLGTVAAGFYFYLMYKGMESTNLREIVRVLVSSAGGGLFTGVVVRQLILYVLCPIFVLEKEDIHTELLDYYAILKSRGGTCHFVRFSDSPDPYEVHWALFQRFRRRVGAPVTYIKRRYPLGVYSIGKIRIDKDFEGCLSNWEKSQATAKRKTVFIIVLVFMVLPITFFLLVMGIAWLVGSRQGLL
jgi:hypothetical protein